MTLAPFTKRQEGIPWQSSGEDSALSVPRESMVQSPVVELKIPYIKLCRRKTRKQSQPTEADRVRAVGLTEVVLSPPPPGDTWRCLEASSVVTVWGGGAAGI